MSPLRTLLHGAQRDACTEGDARVARLSRLGREAAWQPTRLASSASFLCTEWAIRVRAAASKGGTAGEAGADAAAPHVARTTTRNLHLSGFAASRRPARIRFGVLRCDSFGWYRSENSMGSIARP